MIERLCLISREYPPETAWGGIARAVELEARALVGLGVETHVITLAPGGEAGTRTQDGVAVHRIPEPPWPEGLPHDMTYARIGLWSRAVAEKYWDLDMAVRFDSVEACDYFGEALHLYRRDETPLAIWLHTLMAIVWDQLGGEWDGGQRGWAALEIAATSTADTLIAPTELIAQETARHLGERMRPTRLIPYVFDAERFPARDPPSPDGPLRLVYVGRIERRKGVDLVLHAVAAARKAGLDV